MTGAPAAAFGDLLKIVIEGRPLTEDQAHDAFEAIMEGAVAPPLLAGFLIALRMRGETVGEIAAFARSMRRRAVAVASSRPGQIDTCGTGGDGAGTFNVSTVAAFVVASCGVPVAKHGNRSVSGRCGSADLLEGLGIRADLSPEEAARSIDEAGFGFLFAPRLHPSMKHAAATRHALGVRTVFNLLGPLANPAGVRRQVLGVYDAAWVEPLAHVLKELGAEQALVVHGAGLDEIALHGATTAAEVRQGRVRRMKLTPEDAGLKRAPLEAIAGGEPLEHVRLAEAVLRGERGPRRDVVILNAGAALWVAGQARDLAEGTARAAEGIDRGQAWQVVELLRRMTPLSGGHK